MVSMANTAATSHPTLDAGFLDPALDAGFLAVEAGLADARDEGLVAFDAGFSDGPLDSGLAAALEAGFDSGLVYDATATDKPHTTRR